MHIDTIHTIGANMSRNAFSAIELEQIRNDALRDQAKTERESGRATSESTETIENLLSQCRALETVNCEQGKLMNMVIAQRDELLAALESMAGYVAAGLPVPEYSRQMAVSAITKAKP